MKAIYRTWQFCSERRLGLAWKLAIQISEALAIIKNIGKVQATCVHNAQMYCSQMCIGKSLAWTKTIELLDSHITYIFLILFWTTWSGLLSRGMTRRLGNGETWCGSSYRVPGAVACYVIIIYNGLNLWWNTYGHRHRHSVMMVLAKSTTEDGSLFAKSNQRKRGAPFSICSRM